MSGNRDTDGGAFHMVPVQSDLEMQDVSEEPPPMQILELPDFLDADEPPKRNAPFGESGLMAGSSLIPQNSVLSAGRPEVPPGNAPFAANVGPQQWGENSPVTPDMGTSQKDMHMLSFPDDPEDDGAMELGGPLRMGRKVTDSSYGTGPPGRSPAQPDLDSALMYTPQGSKVKDKGAFGLPGGQAPEAAAMAASAMAASAMRPNAARRHVYPAAGKDARKGAYEDEEGEGASLLFHPHDKNLEHLPAYKNMKIRSMLRSAKNDRLKNMIGTNLDLERHRRWASTAKMPFSTEEDAKIKALLRFGYPPSVLRGLFVMMESIEESIEGLGEAQKGDVFSEAVTTMKELVGIKTETAELLLTTRATDGARVMMNDEEEEGDKDYSQPEAKEEGEEVMMTGSMSRPVVDFELLLEHLLTFTPVTPAEDKVELLLDMFSSGDKAAEYISMEDTLRMLTWIRKEADYSAFGNQDRVDIMYQRVLRDYKRALREDNWTDDVAEQPDEVLLEQMSHHGLHRYVLMEVFLSSCRGGRIHFRRGDKVICQNVRSTELNGQTGTIIRKDPRQQGFYIVEFDDPFGEKHIKRTNLRTAPGVEKEGDVNAEEQWGTYALLSLNLRPKVEQDPATLPPVFGWSLVGAWIKKYFVTSCFVISLAVIGGVAFFDRFSNRKDIREIFGGMGGVSITSAWLIKWCMGLIMLSGCSNLIGLIPFKIADGFGGGTSRAYWHSALSGIVFLMILVHVVAASFVMKKVTDTNPVLINEAIGTDFNIAKPIGGGDIIVTLPVLTGIVMFVIVMVMVLSTFFNRESWLWIIGHLLYVPLVVLCMVHPLKGWFEEKYGGVIFFSFFWLVVLLEWLYRACNSTTFHAEEVAIVKSHRGSASGVEYRVRRPEGSKMAQQQAGQYVEVLCSAIGRQWQPGAVVTAPEIEDETVRIQVTTKLVDCEWTKMAEEMVLCDNEQIKDIRIRGPYGLEISDALTPVPGVLTPDATGSGKIVLIGIDQGVHNITAVMNDFNLSLSRPDDAVRRNVSQLHRYVEQFHNRVGEDQLEIHVIAVCKALQGYRRFHEAMLRFLTQESEIHFKITVDVYLTQWACQGTGVECWKRLKKLGSENKHEGKRDEYHDILIEDSIHYGTPDWDMELLSLRYRWLGKTVDVVCYAEPEVNQVIGSYCHSHSYDPSREDLRPGDKTLFSFSRGAVAKVA